MSEHHVLPLRTYLFIFGGLLVLTLLTVAVAFVDLGGANLPVALLIAGTKSMLVILWFMHVKEQTKLTWLFVGAGFVFFVILVAFTLGDYAHRPVIPAPWG